MVMAIAAEEAEAEAEAAAEASDAIASAAPSILAPAAAGVVMMMNYTFLWSSSRRPGARWRTAPPERDEIMPQNPPTPCLWKAPASTWM